MISARSARIDDDLGRGTDGSNPLPSSGESAANLTSSPCRKAISAARRPVGEQPISNEGVIARRIFLDRADTRRQDGEDIAWPINADPHPFAAPSAQQRVPRLFPLNSVLRREARSEDLWWRFCTPNLAAVGVRGKRPGRVPHGGAGAVGKWPARSTSGQMKIKRPGTAAMVGERRRSVGADARSLQSHVRMIAVRHP
jgi:hypothetical protein